MKTVIKRVQNDPDYAWSWHCSLAMMAQDAGAPHRAANERAADFMRGMFGVDVRKSARWSDLFRAA